MTDLDELKCKAQSGDEAERHIAWQALLKRQAVDELIEALLIYIEEHLDIYPLDALQQLKTLNSSMVVPRLLDLYQKYRPLALNDDRQASYLYPILTTICHFHQDKQVYRLLIEELKHPQSQIRASAALGLAATKNTSAIPLLKPLLKDFSYGFDQDYSERPMSVADAAQYAIDTIQKAQMARWVPLLWGSLILVFVGLFMLILHRG